MSKRNYPSEVYLNGKWLPSREATISVFDRGFLFGDGIYEVTPFYKGKPFLLQEHLDRLEYCLHEISIDFDLLDLEKLIFEAVERANLEDKDCAVYMQVTRGVAPRTHHYPENSEPTLFLYAFPVSLEGFEKRHVKAIVSPDYRWQRCDIKSISLVANTMANDDAISSGYFENLLVRNSYFTEGSHSTIFFIKNGEVYTHPEGPHILSGITRKMVIKICRELGISIKEQAVHLDELGEVDEVFLTGTTTQVLSVESFTLDGKEIAISSETGPITKRIQQAFIRRTRGL